jgi:hypothetical protein
MKALTQTACEQLRCEHGRVWVEGIVKREVGRGSIMEKG